jgi:chromosome segregation ATPase
MEPENLPTELPESFKLGHNKLQLEIEKHLEEINTYKIQLNELKSNNERLSKEKQIFINTIEKQNNNIHMLNSEKSDLQNHINDIKIKISDENNKNENVKINLQTEINNTKEIYNQLKITHQQLQSVYNDLNSNHDELKSKYKQLTELNSSHINELEFKKKEVLHLQNELNTLCNHNKTLHQEKSLIKSNIDVYITEINNLKKEVLKFKDLEQQTKIQYENNLKNNKDNTSLSSMKSIPSSGRGLKVSTRN